MFQSPQHEKNFNATLSRWRQAAVNPEYKAACYILAMPIIFEKVGDQLDLFEQPVDWIYDYLHPEEGREPEYDLTGSMQQLGRLSLNLWNGYIHFNLMDCMKTLDAENYERLKVAMEIRMGKK